MKSNFFKKDQSKMIKPSTKVYREQVIEGYSIPALIKNGHYFFNDLDIYENGRVYCWNFEDFESFKNDVARNWVALSVPDNEELSVSELGNWTINEGNWLFNQETFVDYVESLIKTLNPNWDNIYKYREKKIKGVCIGEDGTGTVYKEKYPNDTFPGKVDGASIDLFYKLSEHYFLVKVNVFADHTLVLSRLESPVALSLEALEHLIQKGEIVTEVPLNTTVVIYGLGSFKITKVQYVARIEEKLLELKDILRSLNGQPSSIELCRAALEDYRLNPTLENRHKLKMNYENIPEHQRRYVGDMDTKDIEVRMIIYGQHEIENWSHYQVAKSLGQPLPEINISKPTDENNTR